MKAIRSCVPWSLRENPITCTRVCRTQWSRFRGMVECLVQKRLSRGTQVLGQTLYPYVHHGLHFKYFPFPIRTYTHTKIKLRIERMVCSSACTLLTLHTPRAPNTTCKRPPIFQWQPPIWHCTNHDESTKATKWKWKNEGRISKFCIHTAWHIMHQAHQTQPIWPTPLCHKKQWDATTLPWHIKRVITIIFDTCINSLFSATPKRVVTTKNYFFDVLYHKYFKLLYHEYSITMTL